MVKCSYTWLNLSLRNEGTSLPYLEFTGSTATRHSWSDLIPASGITDQGNPSVYVNSTPSLSHLVESTKWIFQPLVASDIIE
ncbi:MAG: hypothetical protein ACFFCQ_14720 [Promethearchaeota archaeon]